MLSFIIPAHNEEAYLPMTLEALNAAAETLKRPYEVIVVSDASTDRTAEIARERGARVVEVEHRHIAATRNAGAAAARGHYLFFIDADTTVSAAAVAAALAALERGAVGGACLFRYDGRIPWWLRILLPIANLGGRVLTLAGGAFLFCARDEFDAVGGYGERYFVGEDVQMVRALKQRGRFVIPREMVFTSNRKLDRISLWWTLGMLLQVTRGSASFQSREGLGHWYGPEARL